MTEPIVLHVPGLPASQGSKTKMPNGAMVDGTSATGRAKLVEWRRAVADAARTWLAEHPRPPIAEPVTVHIGFRFAPVASDPYRTAHTSKPDIDKLARGVLDSLVHGGLLKDDSYVWLLQAEKRYCQPGETVGARLMVWFDGAGEARERARKKAAAAEARRAAKTAS